MGSISCHPAISYLWHGKEGPLLGDTGFRGLLTMAFCTVHFIWEKEMLDQENKPPEFPAQTTLSSHLKTAQAISLSLPSQICVPYSG